MVPTLMLFVDGLRSSYHLEWGQESYLWFISIFFSFQYVCGLLTCKSKIEFITDIWHIIDLVSFMFFIVHSIIMWPASLQPVGFVVVRSLRMVKVTAIYDFRAIREDLEIYVETMKLAYISSGEMIGFTCFIIIFFSLLIFAFERGTYDPDMKKWIRDGDEDESPFSDLFNCMYFTIVTMTTLGFGDKCPTSYVGKVVACIAACTGICSLTFLINIIGECFEEVFREFIIDRSKRLEAERTLYIEKHVKKASNRLEKRQSKAGRSICPRVTTSSFYRRWCNRGNVNDLEQTTQKNLIMINSMLHILDDRSSADQMTMVSVS